ncbi:MAG: hypothetical protein CBC55_02070 [Gammaproteobacteria bacterium TMED95]|uniref:RNase H type-1 domain-containing protein n=1 Tax=Alteromonas mediterranea TaxID=314275 RepID=A0AAC9JEZ5_9ALTE|nr:hypothetical protein [Alteromonas mediterranea]APD92106.1 hypothetical protein BM524_19490 [Alteromonas mediterranea]APD99960.1 hypothetical protein BM525_19685 [Alteromonas mediterranea]OUV22844.1 MAG: hypothetical protein CBC55_02070 [Gammaproteobacteria bacterium TMED95]
MAQDKPATKTVNVRFGDTKKKQNSGNTKPPLGAMIICDGSYLSEKMVGGIAGTLRIIEPGKPYQDLEYNASTFGVKSSVVVELYAIAAGVQLLSKYAKKNGFHVKELHVFSDSKWGMGGYERMKRGEPYYPAYTPGLKMLSNALKTIGDFMPNFTHVKAHVPNSQANRIERWHNEIDIRAGKQSHNALAQLNRPSKGESYGALLPLSVSKEDSVDLFNMGYAFAKEGLNARVVFDDANEEVSSHPFIDGVHRAASELGKPASTLYQDFTEYNAKSYGQNGARVKNGSMEDFAYRTVAASMASDELKRTQREAYQKGKVPSNQKEAIEPFSIQTNNDNAAMAGEVMMLLHGGSSLQKVYRHGVSPFDEMSQFVLDMTHKASPGREWALNPSTRSDWLLQVKGLHANAQIPVLKTPKAAFVNTPNVRRHIEINDQSILKEELISELDEYMEALTPSQLSTFVQDKLAHYQLKADESLIRQVVNTNNATSPEAAADKIIADCLPMEPVANYPKPIEEIAIENKLNVETPENVNNNTLSLRAL